VVGRIISRLPWVRRFISSFVALCVLLTASGCTTASYLYQAAKGQLELSNRAEPILEVIHDEKTPTRIRKLLSEIPAIKKFGEDHGLRPTRNYSTFVQLARPAAVWVMSACDPLQFKPREWRFPLVGSFTYLGWFDEMDARQYAERIGQEEGLDVDVRGAQAYSTLGWFKDAVLSTMIAEDDEAFGDLINVVLHESVHATLYIEGQSFFNESLASYIADRLTRDYLKKARGAESAELKAYLNAERKQVRRESLLYQAYGQLKKLYATSLGDADKATEKKRILEALQKDLGVSRPMNNATLIQYRTYGVGEAEFDTLYRACGRSWLRFLTSLRALRSKSFIETHQEDLAPVLLPLARDGCPYKL
jgi:predicted aminopeptidase